MKLRCIYCGKRVGVTYNDLCLRRIHEKLVREGKIKEKEVTDGKETIRRLHKVPGLDPAVE